MKPPTLSVILYTTILSRGVLLVKEVSTTGRRESNSQRVIPGNTILTRCFKMGKNGLAIARPSVVLGEPFSCMIPMVLGLRYVIRSQVAEIAMSRGIDIASWAFIPPSATNETFSRTAAYVETESSKYNFMIMSNFKRH